MNTSRNVHNFLFLLFLFFLLGCSAKQEPKALTDAQLSGLKEPLIQQNKKNIQIEDLQIKGFIERRAWPVIETGSGLRYYVYEQGTGPTAVAGKKALVHYTISLINGNECYSTLKEGPHWFVIDMDHVESGLHEGIKFLRVGDKAKIIIPSHLGHGLIGDQNKIPPLSTIIYDIQLLALKD